MKKFCNKECYLKFYKSHPNRYKAQRCFAGHVSIKSFRSKTKFEHAGIKFSSESEKQCAIFLEKEFCLILKEGENCHVRVNSIEVDFLINNIVIEYHQCYSNPKNLSLSKRIEIWRGKKYRYEYRTLDEYFKCRKQKIPKNYNLFVVQNVNIYTLKKLKEQICQCLKNKSTT